MVCLEVNPRRVFAACCSVDVVNGGGGDVFFSFSATADTAHDDFWSVLTISSVTSLDPSAILSSAFPFHELSLASKKSSVPFLAKDPSTVQYSCGTNALISRSRSTINRSATDCTRPAESPGCTLRHKSGDSAYPTSRSKIRRACCAST